MEIMKATSLKHFNRSVTAHYTPSSWLMDVLFGSANTHTVVGPSHLKMET